MEIFRTYKPCRSNTQKTADIPEPPVNRDVFTVPGTTLVEYQNRKADNIQTVGDQWRLEFNPSQIDYATKKDDKMLNQPKTTTRAILNIVKSAIC